MASVLDLSAHRIRVFACQYYNHDYLWFSSFEISKQSTTLPILHNYALSYSLAEGGYGISFGPAPQYDADLARMSLYATPAAGRGLRQVRITYNAINSLSLRTDDKPDGINSPDLGHRVYLAPVFEATSAEKVIRGFSGYLFTFDGRSPRGIVRLGKKGAAMRIVWREIRNPKAFFKSEVVRPTHPVNPLDVSGVVVAYDPVSMPPHLLLRVADIRDDWFIMDSGHTVLLPKRVRARIEQ
jgi:CRISPR-associated protein Csc1